VSSAQVTSNFLGVLESRPLLGRFFTFEEQTNPSAPPVVVLGYGLWTREFGGDSAVVGRQISVSGRKVTVVGVMPEGFTGVELERVDLWRVLPTKVGPAARHWGNGSSMGPAIVGRLRDGLTLEEASAEVTGVQRRTYDGPDKSIRDSRIFAAPLSFGIDGTESTQSRIASWLIVLSIVVLLVACANIVNLQLARGIRQRREMAVRVTLGAGRARLARLLIINSLTLSVIGGTIGLVVAYTAGSLVRRVLLPEVDWTTSPIDSRVMLYTIVAAALTGLLTGVLPALAASRVELSGALKTGTREGGGTRSRVRDGLIVAQAALGMVLLVGAGLFVKSLERVMAADLGLDVNRVVLVRPRWSSVPADKAEAEAARRAAVMQAAAGQFRRLPSVTGVAAASAMPFNGSMAYTLTLPGRTSLPVLEGGFSDPDVSVVSPEYFAAVGTRIVRGRSFTDADRGSHVAVVSQTMAKVLWPGTDAIGQCMQLGKGSDLPCIRIVGIAQDARRSRIKESPIMRYYVPVGQEATFSDQPDLVVRARESVDATAAAVRDAMYHIDPSIRYVDVAPLRDQIEPQTRSWRIGALVFSMFAALVLVVAAVGTFGIVAYVIEQRRHEIGIRVALGARASQIVALMLRGSVVFTAAGVALGAIAVALLAGRATPLLFETSPRDPAVIALVGGLLLAVSVAASLIPAWRAPRVDPMEALRGD
jgi:predicted permease